MPVNWYAALVIIVILGIVSVIFARYEYRHPATASTTPPAKGTTWYAAAAFDVCGTQRAPLASNATNPTKQSFYTTGTGVIVVSPKSTADAGNNAVFGKFVSGYKGLDVSATSITVPAASSTSSSTTTTTTGKTAKTSSHTYADGDTCPTGTKDAGKKGEVTVSYWSNAFASKEKASTVQGDPATLKFTNDQLITVGFVPAGTTLPKPSGTVVTALLQAATGASSTTTTTTPSSTTTTAPSATTTTAPPATTTTTAPPSTTTTAPGSK